MAEYLDGDQKQAHSDENCDGEHRCHQRNWALRTASRAMTPSSATRIHIAIHIAVDVLNSPMPAETNTSRGKTAAATIWPEVCSICSAARPRGA